MKQLIVLALCSVCLAACSDAPDAITVQVCPAVFAAAADTAAAAWDTMVFKGNERAVAGTYLVCREPLFTEWNIVALHAGPQPDGTQAVTARLNAYAEQRLGAFTSKPQNQKRPLAVRINGRWADFVPVLGPITDRITLYGFTAPEAAALRQYVDTR